MKNPYTFHGVDFEDIGTQYLGTCPFCGKPEHFYVCDPAKHDCSPPRVPWGFNCKSGTCQKSGNLYKFLKYLLTNTPTIESRATFSRLLEDRHITPKTAKRFGLVPSPNGRCLIPVYNSEGGLSNVYRVVWHARKGREIPLSTPTCKHHLFTPVPLPTATDKPVWVCEGVWDTIRLAQALPKATVCGIPGDTFQESWAFQFRNRHVILLTDHDEAGVKIRDRAIEKLGSKAALIEYLDWSKIEKKFDVKLPSKYDVSNLLDDHKTGPTFKALNTCKIRANIRAALYREESVAGIEFFPQPVTQIKDLTGPIDWVWEGFVARRYITTIVAYYKAGKTTLITEVFKLLSTGGKLETKLVPTRALLLTEEDLGIWSMRATDRDLTDDLHVLSNPCKGRPTLTQWEKLLEMTGRYCRDHKINLVVIDTLAHYNPTSDENDSSKMGDTIRPLKELAQQDIAIILIHHARKGESAEGQGARGSTALGASSDILIELSRYRPRNQNDTRRTLRTYSRFPSTPLQLTINLTSDGYESLGTTQADAAAQRKSLIESLLDKGTPLTADEIVEAFPQPVSKRSVETHLASILDNNKIVRTGTGKKGDKYRYEKIQKST